jgi:hypothetical protein
MAFSKEESVLPIRILSSLREYPEGVNIIEISDSLNAGKNLVARHLTTLSQIGHQDLRTYGNDKIYRLVYRIPFHLFSIYPRVGAIGFNRSLLIQGAPETVLHILGCLRSDLWRWIEDLPYPLFQKHNFGAHVRRILDERKAALREISHEVRGRLFTRPKRRSR